MSTTLPEQSELARLESEVLENLAEEEGRVEADLDAAGEPGDGDGPGREEDVGSPGRLAAAVACPTIALAVMVGAVFTGVGARLYAAVGGLLGIGLAVLVRRQRRRPVLANVIIVVGLFAIGLLMVVPGGIENITRVRALVSEAAKTADVLRPPIGLRTGWQAIIGWLMGIVGFVAAWIALVLRKPALALLLPLPLAAIPAISVPDDQQVVSGIVALVLFAVSLAILSSAQTAGDADERPSRAYEVRRALRAVPLIAFISVALVVLSQSDFLFPDPYIDPTQEPQRPRTVPLSEVEDRVLFTVESSITGPWRIGNLDVYDGKDWRLPPFADNRLEDVPESGVVDPDLAPGVRARFSVAGLGGAVVPTLPNSVGIIAEGPRLAYDSRNGNIRVAEGQVQAGLSYTVTAAALPTVEALQAPQPLPSGTGLDQFLEIPDPPQVVVDLMAQAPQGSKWETFDYLRRYVLDNVTAAGPGVPKEITPERVADMLTGAKEGTPFEIVATQAMLARWVGIPSRIGYGFDGGDPVEGEEGKLQVRPKHGANFVEVYFPGFKWLPVIGTPRTARPTVGSEAEQQFDPSILPSDEVSVRLFMPVVVEGKSTLAEQVRNGVLVVVPAALLLLLAYATYPALQKAYRRSRRRTAARAAGPRARLALAYAEWRDHAADFGYSSPSDTPLMFLDRFVPDEEHTELAWLVTRALWGDLQERITPELAEVAEELSRALRRRLSQSQPGTARAVAAVSRISVRRPFAPETDLRGEREDRRALAPVPAPA